MRTIRIFFLSFFTLILTHVQAQRNLILNDKIASLQVVAGTDWLSPPVINLHEGTPIHIAFDDLTHQYHRYTYKIEHCEADWSISKDLFTSDFIDGFGSGNLIEDVKESQNTNVLYSHYSFQIPNTRCRLKMSGNYKVTIYDDNDEETPVIECFFMVVEPLMSVRLEVTSNTEKEINGRYQQVNMQVNYGSMKVSDVSGQIHTVVLQNGRWDNAVINPKPQYISADGLRWNHNKNLIFMAGNEYRKFEMLDVSHTTMGLEKINWDGSMYHAYVWPNEMRGSYIYDEDANGAFYIRNSDNIENNRLSDYLNVHFTLKSPRVNGNIYINGNWTNDQLTQPYLLTYDETSHCYKTTLLLKQGYYSYQYLLENPDGTIIPVPSEGSFYQTENKYQALVYFKGRGERTYRLVGYQQVQYK